MLFDQNLSIRLVDRLAETFPGSVHVLEAGLGTADDDVIWDFAASHDLVIVSKDEDFHQRAFLFGPPPKVIWVRLGNCTTQRIGQALQSASALVTDFYAEPGPAFLVIEDSGSRDEPEATRD